MILSALRIFAYVCIWTTPIQAAIALWGLGIVTLTEYSILSLTNIEFIRNYAGFFLPIVEWLYTWFWNAFLDWLFSLPIIIHQTLKAIFTTWLGFWILKRFR